MPPGGGGVCCGCLSSCSNHYPVQGKDEQEREEEAEKKRRKRGGGEQAREEREEQHAQKIEMSSDGAYEVYVHSPDMKFSCAHFVAYEGFRESLHGHNYNVSIRMGGALGADGYVLDFGDIKKKGREICKVRKLPSAPPGREKMIENKNRNHIHGWDLHSSPCSSLSTLSLLG